MVGDSLLHAPLTKPPPVATGPTASSASPATDTSDAVSHGGRGGGGVGEAVDDEAEPEGSNEHGGRPRAASAKWRAVGVRVALGQLASIAMALTGVFITLLVNDNAGAPFLQNLCAYCSITLFALPAHAALSLRADREVHPRALLSLRHFTPRHFRFWRYVAISVFDFGANTLAVWAYNYTDLLSVQLLDCFTIPCVMLLSRVVFKRTPGPSQAVGSVVALCGLVVLVLLDTMKDTQSNASPNPLLGDMLCLAASACYAVSNVACEALMKSRQGPRAERLPMPLARRRESYVAIESDSDAATAAVADGGTAAAVAAEDEITAVEEEEGKAPASAFVGDVATTSDATTARVTPLQLGVEYLAFIAPCGIVYASVAVAVTHDATMAAASASSTADWLYLGAYSAVMVAVYALLPTLFSVTSATFANLSLLSADVYTLVLNLAVFGNRPQPAFFAPFVVIISGVVVYQGVLDVRALFRRCRACVTGRANAAGSNSAGGELSQRGDDGIQQRTGRSADDATDNA